MSTMPNVAQFATTQALLSRATVLGAISAGLSERQRGLLTKAAKVMRDGGSPFDHDFLVTHDVTYDEVMDMSEMFASVMVEFLEMGRAR
jgi:hypothetical protein